MTQYGEASTDGQIGGPLTFSIEETVFPYDRQEREQWQRGELQETLVPEGERSRSKYQNQPDNHYGEVLAMRHLLSLEQGWSWKYENYHLFRSTEHGTYDDWLTWLGETSGGVYREGTQAVADLLGAERMRALWEAGERYRDEARGLRPTEPDLLAFRAQGDKPDVFAIEVKLGSDTVKKGQMLGLALLQAVLGCRVAVFRYLPPDAVSEPERHTYRFSCCR